MWIVGTLIKAGFIAILASFFIQAITIAGIREYFIIRAPKLISKMLECDFCLGFWSSVILVTLCSVITGELNYLMVPFLSAPITRKILQ